MHLICSYCGRYIKEKEPFEVRRNTHGICPDCIIPLLKQDNGLFYDEYLETFDVPVVILDSQCRVAAANQAGLRMMEKPIERVIGMLGGEALECRYSKLAGGCGRTVHCETCTIRNLISEIMEHQIPQYNRSITIDTEKGMSNFTVSTVFYDGLVHIVFENM
ncbi:hypothetical protein SAMN02745220_00387 [Desulfopila aestuarii DSM 18488]|uniref:PAS domain-containing protein n=1 Tax=Desulfopila aestuarii DSM 18488 TaxID=1121416 RepID=A0A1M7XX89_9BACT|nr:hypothetical protein SAMN02745220_00387 [Desulfopila aestuarii DSM 18488]